jgi:predicted Zn-dependent peptidase/predicted Ser/Thr protein kinase
MLSELGRGGMGIVYKARDRETGEVVALKILKPEIAANPQILERFKNELLLAHKITHRRVARLYEFHRAGDAVYLSMEYVEGESLRSVLEREGRLETGRAIEFARQLADGLAEAHRQSIVHRDLKPENIMIGPDGDLKVMDFGISRSFAEDVTVTGSVVGTPAYMAPEQAEGKTLDHRTDIYAFGLILYEMFTGDVPFHGDTAVTLALKQVTERPTNPTKLTPTLPRRIDAAIMKCLEKDPAKRFQSVEEAFQALAGVATPDGPKARPKTAKSGRRKFVWAALGAVAAMAAAAVWRFSRPSDSVVFPLEQFTLANGLKVALSPDHASPTFTLVVAYRAGLRRDTPGHAALSHLVQHATYEGTPNIGRGEYKDLIGATGGELGGGATTDTSLFYVTLPANQLELALFLEADRMRGLEITQEGLDAARAGVLQERAQVISYATARFRFNALAFDNFVNRQSGYGTVEELNRATVEEVRQFYRTYYMPSNASMSLVGDFDSGKTRELVKHYFDGLPARPAPPAPDLREPGRTTEKRETVAIAGIPTPLIIVAWQVPAATETDWYALDRLADVLGGTGSARLQNSLVKTASMATQVTVGLDESAGPNLLTVQLLLAPGKDPAQAERMVYQEIDRVAREGVPKEEMERVETNSLRRRAFQLTTTQVRAMHFVDVLSREGTIDAVNHWEKQLRAIGSGDVKRVALKYLTPARRTVLILNPGGKP